MTRRAAVLVALSASLAVGGCVGPGEPGLSSAPIVGGTREMGRPEVVFLYNLRGAACTGTIISPFVVLTANHCVEVGDGRTGAPSSFRVYVGSSTRQLTAEYLVSEIRPVPDAGLSGRRPNDVALVVLASPATETPMELSRVSPRGLFGQTITAVGFGQTPSGGSGVKYTTTALVNGYESGFVLVEPAVCSGDSGGPLIAPDGTVAGVASFIFSPDGRTRPQCGTAPGAYNEIFRHLEFIDQVLEETGSCVPDEAELCNGEDDNCDGVVDEGCLDVGEPCSDDDECFGGLCGDTPAGRLCTSVCDPLRPEEGCSPGLYCADAGCEGFCVPGSAGALPYGEACEADTDCFSLHCRDPGDGERRCLEPCQHDAGLCLGGEACVAPVGGCGSCVDMSLFAGRGLGEPCEADLDCGAGRACLDVAGIRECVAACADDGTCPTLFTCRDGQCIRDRTQGVGGVCQLNDDCGDGVCATAGDRSWCTIQCGAAEDCPSGFDCVEAAGINVCAPATSLDGEACVSNEDCASGVCASGPEGSFCTRGCDARTPCAPGFACQRIGGESNAAVCIQPVVSPPDEGGCAAAGGPARPRAGGAPLALFGLGLLGFALRRRRERL